MEREIRRMKTLRKRTGRTFLCASVCLVVFICTACGSTGPQPADGTGPPAAEQEAELKERYLEHFYEQYGEHSDSVQYEYIGTYSGHVLSWICGSEGFTQAQTMIRAGGFLLVFPSGQEPLLFAEGGFYRIDEAYDEGFITDDDIYRMGVEENRITLAGVPEGEGSMTVSYPLDGAWTPSDASAGQPVLLEAPEGFHASIACGDNAVIADGEGGTIEQDFVFTDSALFYWRLLDCSNIPLIPHQSSCVFITLYDGDDGIAGFAYLRFEVVSGDSGALELSPQTLKNVTFSDTGRFPVDDGILKNILAYVGYSVRSNR